MASLNDLALRIIFNGEDRTQAATRSMRGGIESVGTQLEGLRNLAQKALEFTIFSSLGQEAIRLADTYKSLQGRLKLVADSQEEFVASQKEVFRIAQQARGALESVTLVYAKIESAVDRLNGTQQHATVITETLLKAIALTSQGAQQDAAGLLQFNQAIDNGALRGEEFNSVLENTPGVMQAIATGLGVTQEAMRGLAESGQLTSVKIFNALLNQRAAVDKAFAALPLTVGQALSNLNNQILRFVGETDNAHGATQKLAGVIVALGDHLDELAEAGRIAAEIYAGKLVLGLIRSGETMAANRFAVTQLAAAQEAQRLETERTLQSEVRLAEVRLAASRTLLDQARLEAALARTATERRLATDALTQAIARLHAAESGLSAAQARLNAALNPAPQQVGRLARSMQVLGFAVNAAFGAWIAFDIGKTVGEWLLQFGFVRQAGIRVAEAFVLAQTGIEALLNGVSFADRTRQIAQIHAQFNELVQAASDSAQRQTEIERLKGEEIDKLIERQETTFKRLHETIKGLGEAQKTQYQQQLADLDQYLAEQSAKIQADAELSEQQKQQAILTGFIQASATKLAATETFNQLQLQQITEFANQERTLKQAQLDALGQAEKEKRERLAQDIANLDAAELTAKRKIYADTLQVLTGHVGDLITARQREADAARSIDDQILANRERAQKTILELQRLGLSDEELRRSKDKEESAALAAFKKELAKEGAADQEKLNKLADTAIGLIADNAKEKYKESGSDYARSQAIAKINQVQGDLNKTLGDAKTKHIDNKTAIENELKAAQDGVDGVTTALAEIDRKLVDGAKLVIKVDQDSLTAAQRQIAELAQPETKVITVVTQSQGQPPVLAGQSSGGPAGFASGLPWRFADGGFARPSGRLPGYGGGDKIRALLEAGEFVIRKEAVQKLGINFFVAANQGQAPALPKFATGGLVAQYADELAKKKFERDKKVIENLLANPLFFGLDANFNYSVNTAIKNAQKILHNLGRKELLPRVRQILSLNTQNIRRTTLGQRLNAFDRAAVLTEHLFDTEQRPTPSFSLPDSVRQFGQAQAAAATPGSQLVASSGKTVTVKFEGKSGVVSGAFDQQDVNKFIKILEDAAGVSSISGGYYGGA